MKLDLQWFAKGSSGGGGGGGGGGTSRSVSKRSFGGSAGGSGIGRNSDYRRTGLYGTEKREQPPPASLYPQHQVRGKQELPKSTRSSDSSSSKGTYVYKANPRESYSVYSVRDTKETYAGDSTGADIMKQLRYDSHNNVWRDSTGKRYKIRKR